MSRGSAERKLLRIYCSRPRNAHMVGAVVATVEGELELRITVPVADAEGTEAVKAVVRDVDSLRHRGHGVDRERIHYSTDAWCEVCRRPYPIDLEDLFTIAESRAKGYRLTAEGEVQDPVKYARRRLQAQRSDR